MSISEIVNFWRTINGRGMKFSKNSNTLKDAEFGLCSIHRFGATKKVSSHGQTWLISLSLIGWRRLYISKDFFCY